MAVYVYMNSPIALHTWLKGWLALGHPDFCIKILQKRAKNMKKVNYDECL